MKVRITSGGYGLKKDENRMQLILRGEIVDVPDEEAALLIEQGAAVAVTADSWAGEKPESDGEVSTSASPENNEDGQESAEGTAYSMDNTAAELKAIMEAEGLKIRSGMTKQEMIDALDEHFGSDEEAGDDEQPPDLNTEDLIV